MASDGRPQEGHGTLVGHVTAGGHVAGGQAGHSGHTTGSGHVGHVGHVIGSGQPGADGQAVGPGQMGQAVGSGHWACTTGDCVAVMAAAAGVGVGFETSCSAWPPLQATSTRTANTAAETRRFMASLLSPGWRPHPTRSRQGSQGKDYGQPIAIMYHTMALVVRNPW